MTVQILYKNKDNSNNLVLFVDESFNTSGLKKYLSSVEFFYISDLLKNSDLKKNLLFFHINSKKTIFLVSIKKNMQTSDMESLGAEFHGYINSNKKSEYTVSSDSLNGKFENFIGHFLHGL